MPDVRRAREALSPAQPCAAQALWMLEEHLQSCVPSILVGL